MDLVLSPEEEMLVNSVRAALTRKCTSSDVRGTEASERGYDPGLWKLMCENGWPALLIPEAFAGSNGGLLAMTLVGEELGRVACDSPTIPCMVVFAKALLIGGQDALVDEVLPKVAAGALIGSMSLGSCPGEDRWNHPGVLATERGCKWSLSGEVLMVPYASSAALVLVVARTGMGLTAFCVDPRSNGVRIRRHDSVGGEALFAMALDEVHVAADRIVGGLGGAESLLDRTWPIATVVGAAYAVGLCETALRLSLEHVRSRHQFGRPLGAFQAVAHRCVDMRLEIDAARSLLQYAAWRLDEELDAAVEVAAAKLCANQMCQSVARGAHQVNGAMGFSTEYDLQLFTRRAKAFELTYGSTVHHLEQVAAALVRRAHERRDLIVA
jgi:alkylation response protein AidB-like acyl-CoA dehydrogenase